MDRERRDRGAKPPHAMPFHRAALIYDLQPIASVELVKLLRTRHPWLPTLLYPPLLQGVIPLVLAAGRIPGVTAIGQARYSAEPTRLRAFVRRTLGSAPVTRLACTRLRSQRPIPAAERAAGLSHPAVHYTCSRVERGEAQKRGAAFPHGPQHLLPDALPPHARRAEPRPHGQRAGTRSGAARVRQAVSFAATADGQGIAAGTRVAGQAGIVGGATN